MAILDAYTLNIKKIAGDTATVRKSIFDSQKSIQNINAALGRKTRIRSEIFKRRQELNRRRLENESRKEQEDVLEYSKMSSISKTPQMALQRSGKSFLGRIMDFISNMAIGWLLYNLPAWIGMATEFVKRITKLVGVIQGIVQSTAGIVISIGTGITNVVSDIVRLDFASLPNDVSNAFNGLQTNINNMSNQFEEGFKLFSTGLDKSLTGTEIPQIGEQVQDQSYQPSGLSLSGGAPGAPATANAGYRRIYEAARAAGDPFPEVTAAQWAIESGYGKYKSGKNNPFGQKAGANEPGTVVMTQEYVNGRYVSVPQKFKDFASEEEAIKYRLQRWGSKYGNARTPEEALRNLQLPTGARIPGTNQTSFGVYATSPTYVQNVSRIIREQGGNPQRVRTVAGGAPAMTPVAISSGGGGLKSVGDGRSLSSSAADAFVQMKKFAQTQGVNISLTSAYRDSKKQAELYALYKAGKGPLAAPPGKSMHEKGLAIDVAQGPALGWMYKNSSRFGWKFINIPGENWHFEYQGGGGVTPQISPTQSTQGAMDAIGITPSSAGESIDIVIPEMGLTPAGGGGGGGSGGVVPEQMMQQSETTVLNNFVKNHFLVELAYL